MASLSQPTLLIVLATIGAAVMVFQHRPLLFPVIAAVVSAFELLSTFGVAHISVARVPLGLVFGAALLVSGIIVWLRAVTKPVIASATVVALVGALQLFAALRR